MRIEGWEGLLARHVEQADQIEFKWGTHDCALWCAAWVKAATGRDFADDWAGLYDSEDELEELLLARGITSPSEIPTRAGLRPIAVSFAQRGDIVLWQGCLGICMGLRSHFLTERGVTAVPTAKGTAAWRVG